MKNLKENEMKAVAKLAKYVGVEDIQHSINIDELSINKITMNGKQYEVASYVDEQQDVVCIINTLEIITNNEETSIYEY